MRELSLSLRFNGHFPGEPGLASVYWSKGLWKWWWQLELYIVQSSSQIITTNKPTPSFLQAGCPCCRPTNNVKALKGKISHSMELLIPAHLVVFQLCLRPLIAGRVAMPLNSPLMPVPLPPPPPHIKIYKITQHNQSNSRKHHRACSSETYDKGEDRQSLV